MINVKHKDRLFCFIFGREENKKWTLSLYNAVNGSAYTDPGLIQITTIEDVLYMGMKNDVSFIIADTVSIYEQQSTYNPNMPIRELMYAAKLYDKYIHANKLNIYGDKLIPLPLPKLVVFYNGKEDREDEVLELKDAFQAGMGKKKGLGDTKNESDIPDIAVRVRMIAIDHGRNKGLLEACDPLAEYVWLIQHIREYEKEMEIEEAVDRSIDEMPEGYEIRPFLVGNRAEVKQMCITEYNEEETMQLFKEQWRKEGCEEGINIGAQNKAHEIAKSMILANEPGDRILLYTGLEREEVDQLAEKLHTVLTWDTKK